MIHCRSESFWTENRACFADRSIVTRGSRSRAFPYRAVVRQGALPRLPLLEPELSLIVGRRLAELMFKSRPDSLIPTSSI